MCVCTRVCVCVCVCVCICVNNYEKNAWIYQPQDATQCQFLRSFTGLNSEFAFSQTGYLTRAKEPNLPDYLTVSEERIIWIMPFPRVFALCEMQTASLRIWTCVTLFISYHHTVAYPYLWKCRTAYLMIENIKPGEILPYLTFLI